MAQMLKVFEENHCGQAYHPGISVDAENESKDVLDFSCSTKSKALSLFGNARSQTSSRDTNTHTNIIEMDGTVHTATAAPEHIQSSTLESTESPVPAQVRNYTYPSLDQETQPTKNAENETAIPPSLHTPMLPPDIGTETAEHISGHQGKSVQQPKMSTGQRNEQKHLLTDESQNGLYQCDSSKGSFFKSFRAKRHVRTHLGTRPFKCCHCQKSFNQSRALQNHIQIQHGATSIDTQPPDNAEANTLGAINLAAGAHPVPNDTCEMELEEGPVQVTKSQIQEEKTVQNSSVNPTKSTNSEHSSRNPFSCNDCNRPFFSKKSLLAHLDWHRQKSNFFQCTKCAKAFYHASGLEDHILHTHGATNININPFPRGDDETHQNLHLEKSTEPDDAKDAYLQNAHLRSYKSIGENGNPTKIYYPHTFAKHLAPTSDTTDSTSLSSYDTLSSADSAFYDSTYAEVQQPKKLQNSKVSFKLQKIQMNASSTMDIKTKTPRRYFKCSICTSTFYKDSEYNKHMMEHEEGMTFTCMACDITFSTSSELNRHYATHPGVRPYKCTVCDKAFIQATHLKFHMRRHTGEKPFQCKVCQKRFPRHAHLQEHMFLHAGEKLHRCTVCDKRFTQPTGLRSHMKRTHPDHIKQTHKCPYCPVSFESKQGRSLHILNVHREEDPSSSSTSVPASTSAKTDDSVSSIKPDWYQTLQDDLPLHPGFKQIIALPVKMMADKIVVCYEDKLVMEWTYDSKTT